MTNFQPGTRTTRAGQFAAALALAAGVSLASITSAAAAPSACNAFDAQAGNAMALRWHKDFAGAQAVVDQILAADAKDFRANYAKALLLFDQSNILHSTKYDMAKVQAGFAQLKIATGLLEQMSGDCLATARTLGWGSIYNTLGVYQFAIGDKKSAEQTWLNAYRTKRPLMTTNSQILLLNNLGLLYDDNNFKRPDLTAQYRREALDLQLKANPASFSAPTRLQSLIPKFTK